MNSKVCIALSVTLFAAGSAHSQDSPSARDMTPEEVSRWMSGGWANQLFESENPHHLLAGAKLAGYAKFQADQHNKFARTSDYTPDEFLSRALSIAPDDALVLSTAYVYCSRGSLSAVCYGDHSRRLASVDTANGAAWLIHAEQVYSDGDTTRALELLRRAAGSAQFDIHFAKQLLMYDSALREYRSLTEAEYAFAAIGMAAGSTYMPVKMFGACEQETVLSIEWREVCRQLGQLMEGQGRTDITRSLGLSLQTTVLELDGPSDELNEAKSRREKYKEQRQAVIRAEEVIPDDDPFWSDYFQAFVEDGEFAAWELAERVVSERAGAGHTDQL